eukprot:6462666-Amphidinium_carterae.2
MKDVPGRETYTSHFPIPLRTGCILNAGMADAAGHRKVFLVGGMEYIEAAEQSMIPVSRIELSTVFGTVYCDWDSLA